MRRVFAAAVLLVLGYVLVQMSQPYLHSYQFDRLVERELLTGSLHPDTAVIHKRVLQQARDMGFIVDEDDVQVERLVRGYQVRVHYLVPVEMRFYKAAIDFTSVARTTTDLNDTSH